MATANDHPPDCECCVNVRLTPGARRGGDKRAREDADLSTFLPEEPEPPEEEGEAAEERLLSSSLFAAFDAHVVAIDVARKRRREMLAFRSAAEEDGQTEEVSADASQDEIDGLGTWMPTDTMQGDVNMRTLQKLLTRVDQRGYERSAQQPLPLPSPPAARSSPQQPLGAHHQERAAARVPRGLHEGRGARHLPRLVGDGAPGDHASVRLGQVEFGGADIDAASLRVRLANAVVRIRGREGCARFVRRKTFSIAIFCACLSLAFGLEIGKPQDARPLARLLTRSLRPQSSSLPPAARRASCSSGSSSDARRSNPADRVRARRPLCHPVAGLSASPAATSASASTTRRPAG
jgi:hypothetical protein